MPVPRILKGLTWVVLIGVLAVGGLLFSMWAERQGTLTLPVPTGPFAVGRSYYDWADSTVSDSVPTPGEKRELLAWIWYPSDNGSKGASPTEYVPTRLRPAPGPAGGILPSLFALLTRDPSNVRAHSIQDARLSSRQRSYPVVIMRAGAAQPVWHYTTLAEDLASHGYVVVGFDAPYFTTAVVFPDGRAYFRTPENNPELCVSHDHPKQEQCVGRIISAWTRNTAFALDRLTQLNAADSSGRFTGRLDLSRLGLFGHSLGGAVTAQFCSEDARCNAGVDVDGAPHGSVVKAGLRQPFMFLLSDHTDAADSASREILADIRAIYDRLPPTERFLVAIRGGNHFTFSDDGALLKSRVVRGVLRVFGKLDIDGRRQLVVTAYCLRSFFDRQLAASAGAPAKPPFLTVRYPEIQVLDESSRDRR